VPSLVKETISFIRLLGTDAEAAAEHRGQG
jgi:hypothetical protein